MKSKNLFTALLCFFLSIGFLSAQEICNNAIDDDGDGLIDLNDDDCECASFVPSSLIPNPSFEEMSCCPMNEAQLDCADEWIQASGATTDYIHECGILGLPFIDAMAPLPLPDGMGAIGFRDGKPGAENFKEYTGACLMEPLKSGQTYMLDFFVGFRDVAGSFRLDMAVYASMDCSNLPFGSGDTNFGCPTNGPGFVQLGEMSYSGINEWVNASFEFTPDQDYNVIVLGPACEVNTEADLDPYFFFDRLILAELGEFGIPIVDVQGGPCTEELILVSSEKMAGTYQWYKDGVAIIGETGPTLSIPDGPDREGTYMVVVENASGCFAGDEYVVEIIESETEISEAICDGEVIIIDGEEYGEAGTFAIDLESVVTGCDSTVLLELVVNELSFTEVETSICAGESVIISGVEYFSAGSYTQSFTNQFGCDSTLSIIILPEPGCDDCQPRPAELIVDLNIVKVNQNLFTISLVEGQVLSLDYEELSEFVSTIGTEKEKNTKDGLLKLMAEKSADLCYDDIVKNSNNQSSSILADQILKSITDLNTGRSLNYTITLK